MKIIDRILRIFCSGYNTKYDDYADLFNDVCNSPKIISNNYIPDQVRNFLTTSEYNGKKLCMGNLCSIFEEGGYIRPGCKLTYVMIHPFIEIDETDKIYQKLLKYDISLEQFSLMYFINKVEFRENGYI